MFGNIITVIRCNKQMNAGNKSLDRGLMILHELTNTGGGLNEGAFLLSENGKTKKQILNIGKYQPEKNFQCLLMKTFTHIIHNIFLRHALLSNCPEGQHGAIPKGNCLLSTPSPRGQG